jgi:predicted phosphodiesterase
MGIKEILQANRARAKFVEAGNAIEDFREQMVPDPLPPEKAINRKSDEHDQCFIIIPDIHSYNRDKKAFDLCMKSLPILNKKYNVTKFVQLGDALECGEASSHPTTNVFERPLSYVEELNWAENDFWKPAMKALPNANFYALMGNHEDRWNKKIAGDMKRSGYRQEYAIDMYNSWMPFDLYKEWGIHVVPHSNEDPEECILELIPNKLLCLHGWSHSKHSADTHLRAVQGNYSIIHAHTHRSQHHSTRNPIKKNTVSSWSFGSLAKVAMMWHNGKPTEHTLGFGMVMVYDDIFSIQEIQIHITENDGRKLILPEGTVLTA